MMGLLAAAAAGTAGVAATPASAAPVTTPNACHYSFSAEYYRDTRISIDAGAVVLDGGGAPADLDVVPGRKVRTTPGTPKILLPDDLAKDGYAGGMLQAGENVITARVWLAIQATNTREGVQVVGPITVTATTTINVDPSDDHFLNSTPFVYNDPVIPPLTWTATGGDIAFSQADGDAFGRAQGVADGRLPVGTALGGGQYADRIVRGSAVIHLPGLVPDPGFLFLDCQPGAVVDPVAERGSDFVSGPAVAFATLAANTNNICLSQAGRRLEGAATGLPAGETRELDPAKITLARAGAAPAFSGTAPYTLDGVSFETELTGSTIAALADFPAGGPLITEGQSYPVRGWVTVAATNTVEGRRTLPFTGAYTPSRTTPGPGDDPVWQTAKVTANLPASAWTPTRKGPIEFRVAAAGTSDAVTLKGPETGGPEGPVVATTFSYAPFGSTVLSLGTNANDTTLDCASAIVTVADGAIGWSNRGAFAPPAGSLGRYSLLTGSGDVPFATATDPSGYDTGVQTGSDPLPGDQVPPPLSGTTTIPPPPPVGRPTQPVDRSTRVISVRIPAQKLKRSRGAVAVKLGNLVPSRTTGRLSIVTKRKLRIGKAKARRITIGTSTKVSLGGGRTGSVRVRLTSTAAKLLRSRRSVTVTVTFTPTRTSTQKTIMRTLTLRR